MTPVPANVHLTAPSRIASEPSSAAGVSNRAGSSALADSSPHALEFLNRMGLIDKMAPVRALNKQIRLDHPQMDELFTTIQASADLTKRFLKFANSPWFNSRIQVDSPSMAFSRFGTGGFYRLMVATYLQDSIGELSTKFRIWPHLEWTARAGDMVAQQLAPKYADETFAAGILHDAVVAPMERELQDYLYLLECALGVDPHVTSLETDCHEFNHAQAATELARALDFQDTVVQAIFAHHSENLPALPDAKARAVCSLLFVTKTAIAVARNQKKNSFETAAEKNLLREMAAALGVSTGRIVNTIADVVDNLHLPAAA